MSLMKVGLRLGLHYRASLEFVPGLLNRQMVRLGQCSRIVPVRNRWSHRRPSKIFMPGRETEIPVSREQERKRNKPYWNKETDFGHTRNIGVQGNHLTDIAEINNNHEMNEDGENEDGENNATNEDREQATGTEYVKLKDGDTQLSAAMLQVKSRKTREKSGLILLEGKRLIQDAILAGVVPQIIFFSRKTDIENLTMPPGVVKLYKVMYKQLQLWSELTTTPGIIAICRLPKGAVKQSAAAMPLTIVCDNVRDPGNLGSILRIAAGAGCRKLILTLGCVDLWDPKVLRSGAGSHFRLPVERNVSWTEIYAHLEETTSLFVADHMVDTSTISSLPLVPYYSVNYAELDSVTLIMGGETEGLSKEALMLAHNKNGARINIPLFNHVDSLNVGAALSAILFEIRRQFSVAKYVNDDIKMAQGLGEVQTLQQ